jgi:hypothetical protein
MAARKIQTSKVANSIKALMDALNDEILPDADELRKDGWVSAKDYATATNRHPTNCKPMLDNAPNIEKRKALHRGQPTMMYRVKK